MTTATQRQQPFFGDSFFLSASFRGILVASCRSCSVFIFCAFWPFRCFCASLQQGELLSNTAVRVSCFRTLRKWSQLVICCFVFILMDNSIQRIFWFRVLFCAYVIDPLLTPNTGGRVFVCVVFSLVDPC